MISHGGASFPSEHINLMTVSTVHFIWCLFTLIIHNMKRRSAWEGFTAAA